MKENFKLLKPDLPPPGTKGWLVVEHLTHADLKERGDDASSDGVIRISLCNSRSGDSPVPVYELLLEAGKASEVHEAHDRIRTWASGFIMGARYAGCQLGITIKTPQLIHS